MMATDRTITAILDASERLFASGGYDHTSIREITRQAEVNVAAVHYHFGDKATLLRAVLDRTIGPMNERRIRMLELAQAAASPGYPSVSEVIEAFVRPDIETMQRRGATVAHFLGRIYSDQSPWIQSMAIEQFSVVGDRFGPALAVACPHIDGEELEWRLRQVVVLLIHAFATWPIEAVDESTADLTVDRLVRFTAAGFAPTIREEEQPA